VIRYLSFEHVEDVNGEVERVERHGHVRLCSTVVGFVCRSLTAHTVASSSSNTDELSAVSRRKLTRCIDQVTKEIPNSPAQKRAPRQVSLTNSSTALALSSLPSHPGSSTLIDCALEGPHTAENSACRWSDEEKPTDRCDQCRRTSFAPYPGRIAD
jgi:hypothetical protein